VADAGVLPGPDAVLHASMGNPGSVYPAAGQHTVAGSGYYSLLFVRRR
jgi:hypothetical protein